ncbi:Bug family tripartite tricarboxylate transporter substrate binding protein [Paracraurococcus lichenis]|uniref:Tripartite tricarboxylate transporter substrate-binding protein n=1 Tax=Paracraurococcus lichenis TaxID=3064888 RepID=A0ABT9DTB1_9PROT|nr:tripartite tricarboxylate transporter substrate-binding protein [Paracraurococcus sp. LOR1-02]MDO9707135.1 tripartite tricarboxylate transporter substrate-binding protein [Paracraurococcus sp. LOR1-02]
MRCTRRTMLAVACLATGAAKAQTEAWPTRLLRMWVPFTPGGPMDIFGRPLAERLGEKLGQTVVFENKPGANGIVATHQIATARPDGGTLLFTTGSFIGNLAFSQQPLPYDPMRDVAPVTLVADGTGMMLVASPRLGATSMAELAAIARARGGLTCAISGFGNITHLAAEQFKAFTGTELVLVTLHGTAPSLTEILAGNVDITFSTIPPALPFLREGSLRAIGYTGRRRALLVPETPTMKEQGFAEWELIGMMGLWTTAGTPPERILKVQRAVREIVHAPDFTKLLREGEFEPQGGPPEEFADVLQRELAMQLGIARRVGLASGTRAR